MDKTLLFFYGFIIFGIMTAGVSVYTAANIKEAKKEKINHSNYGCG